MVRTGRHATAAPLRPATSEDTAPKAPLTMSGGPCRASAEAPGIAIPFDQTNPARMIRSAVFQSGKVLEDGRDEIAMASVVRRQVRGVEIQDVARLRGRLRPRSGGMRQQLVFETGRFRLYVNRDDQVLPFVPALDVEDYEAAREFLKSSGCEIVRDWPKSKALYFRDPLGQIIDIKETNWM